MVEISKADATASRAFFVRMLTRDISLEDCILDLLDNSVDSAWKNLGAKRLSLTSGPDFSKVSIDIDFDVDSFSIRDNGGGMTLVSAEKYAFTFGRKDEDPEDTGEFSIGVYGIGLKRAVFKIGTNIWVHSTYTQSGKRNSFVVPIDVNSWVKQKGNNWDFPIESSGHMDNDGLSIEVTGLTDLARASFQDPEFEPRLRATVARDYALHLHRGLKVKVNGVPVMGEKFTLFEGAAFKPLNTSYEEKIGKEIVHVEIISGLAFPPPEDNEPNDRGERESKSGWYVACNGRIVMAADKSVLSVWGDDFPAWHPQYTGFFGLIIFTSDRTDLLPLTTTKRSVDLSSVVYRRARPKMKEPTRSWINYTNVRKTDQGTAKLAEQEAKQTSIFSLTRSGSVSLPVLTRTRVKDTSIQFRMLTVRVKSLAKGFGDVTLSNSEVGRKAFEYAYEDLVEE